MVINKWNPISFGLAFKVELFLLAHPKWLLDFHVYYVSNNLSAFIYIVWIHKMEAKQYGIKILVMT